MNDTRTTWKLDPSHSNVNFAVKHMMLSNVHGGFHKLSGTLMIDQKNKNLNTIEVNIESASIDTHEEKRDEHLRGKDFFDVKKFPLITFKSKYFEGFGGERFKLGGDLTLHGVTKEISFEAEGFNKEVKDQSGNIKIGASATTTLSRKDYGLVWSTAIEAGGVVVADEVKISLDVQFTKSANE